MSFGNPSHPLLLLAVSPDSIFPWLSGNNLEQVGTEQCIEEALEDLWHVV